MFSLSWLHNSTLPGRLLRVCSHVTKFSPIFFTSRKQSLRKLCFYTCLSAILFTGGGGACVAGGHALQGVHAWQGGAWVVGGMGGGGHGRGACVMGACMPRTPPSGYYGYGIRSISGQYASYWNAFLYLKISVHYSVNNGATNPFSLTIDTMLN